MKISSAKAKGRRASVEVKDLLEKYAPDLRPGDIDVTCSSMTGCDLKLSPAAKEIYPFAIECKNTETISIWKAFQQAEAHAAADPGTTPVLFFKRNRSELMVCLRAEDLMKLVR